MTPDGRTLSQWLRQAHDYIYDQWAGDPEPSARELLDGLNAAADRLDALAALRPRLMRLATGPMCPSCGVWLADKVDDHRDGCVLAAVLALLPEEGPT